MRKALPAAAATATLGLILGASPALADSHEDGAVLSVLHGVPDLTVDVYVNGERALDDFAPGELAGPLELPAGDIEIAITASDAEDASSPVIGPVPATLESGGNHTAVAHLDESGTPTASAFVNDTSSLEAGQGRLTVRHVAAAPAVDVWADGAVAVPGLANPDEASLELPAGTLEAAVSPAGETEPVLGPQDVEVAEGGTTIVYAWGSAEDGSLALAAQTIEEMHSAPGGVPTGDTQVPVVTQGTQIALGAGALLALAAGAYAVRSRVGIRD